MATATAARLVTTTRTKIGRRRGARPRAVGERAQRKMLIARGLGARATLASAATVTATTKTTTTTFARHGVLQPTSSGQAASDCSWVSR
jgi:hypothetical protein